MSSETKNEWENSLFHYTDWKGLNGILETQTLWATHWNFLNDSSEMRIGLEKLKSDCLKAVGSNILNKSELESLIENAVNGYASDIITEFYIASFCSVDDPDIYKHGLLSQWRAYGKDGGFAIELDKEKLDELKDKETDLFYYGHYLFEKVNYLKNGVDVNLSRDKCMDFIDCLREIAKNKENANLDKLKRGHEAICYYMASFKHLGFQEENETRLVYWPVDMNRTKTYAQPEDYERMLAEKRNEKPRLFRGGVIPYIELFGKPNTLPIKRIIVGPHKDKEKRVEALKLMLRDPSITVEPSGIPYIG